MPAPRRPFTTFAALSSVLVTTTATLSVSVSTATAETPGVLSERISVETPVDTDGDGRKDRVTIDIKRPSGGGKVPVIFEFSPYRSGIANVPNHSTDVDRLPQEKSGERASGRSESTVGMPRTPGWYDGYFIPKGYAVAYGDSIGTSTSTGCPTSGDRSEAAAAVAAVNYLSGRARGFDRSGREVSAASWSSGAVGMIGVSYNGTLPNMVAAGGVEGLKAIVPIGAIADWYDYYRSNGLVVSPGGYPGEDADVLAKAVVRRGACAERLAELTRTQGREHGDHTDFWKRRGYIQDAEKVKAAVFVIHGHNDWNVKGQNYANWWDALKTGDAPRKIWLHAGGHEEPRRADYRATVGRWFDKYLKGVDNGIDREPIAEMEVNRRWHKAADWPDPAATPTTYHLGAASATDPGTLTTQPAAGSPSQSFTDNGRTTRTSQLVGSPEQSSANRLVYTTPALTEAKRLSGRVAMTLNVAVENRTAANLTAMLVDYSGGSGTIITKGWADPQNHASLEKGEPLTPGRAVTVRFQLQPKEYVVPAGHRLGIVIASTDYDYTLRPTPGTRLRIDTTGSTAVIPLASN